MAIITIGNIDVVVRSRDEHCPPHVHADCPAEGWSARFTFSFISDAVAFWDFTPDNPKREPGIRKLTAIGQAIDSNLERIRGRWWAVMGTVCLENRYVRQTADGQIVTAEKRPSSQRGLRQIQSGVYDPATRTTILTLAGGATWRVEL